MFIDENGIIAISEENKLGKEYQISLSGYFFSCFNKKVLTLHKKKVFEKDIKDLGQGMQIFFCKKEQKKCGFDVFGFEKAFCLFDGFDENTGEKYFFLYKKNKKETDLLQSFLEKLKIKDLKIILENNITKVKILNEKKLQIESLNLDDCVSFIFGLSLIYGKYMVKKNTLQSIKIQIPLFGTYLNHQEKFDKNIDFLIKEGLFVQKNISDSNNGIVYQMSITDLEFLKILGDFYQKLDNGEEIIFKNENLKNKELVSNFCQKNNIRNILEKEYTIKTLKVL